MYRQIWGDSAVQKVLDANIDSENGFIQFEDCVRGFCIVGALNYAVNGSEFIENTEDGGLIFLSSTPLSYSAVYQASTIIHRDLTPEETLFIKETIGRFDSQTRPKALQEQPWIKYYPDKVRDFIQRELSK